jgi:pyrophosphatase PpaX
MSIKYALFDFDGTLIDSNEAVISSLNHVAIKYRGFPFNTDELNQILGKPIQDQMFFLSEAHTQTLVEMYRIEYRRVQDDLTKIYEGVVEMLSQLKSMGIRTGIVSNKGRHGINHGINQFDLHDLIEVTVSLDDVTRAKPHEEGIFKALKLLGVSEEALTDALKMTLFVGDSGHDIETAHNAGCTSVLVSWTLIDMKQLLELKPDHVIHTPGEILELITKTL